MQQSNQRLQQNLDPYGAPKIPNAKTEKTYQWNNQYSPMLNIIWYKVCEKNTNSGPLQSTKCSNFYF